MDDSGHIRNAFSDDDDSFDNPIYKNEQIKRKEPENDSFDDMLTMSRSEDVYNFDNVEEDSFDNVVTMSRSDEVVEQEEVELEDEEEQEDEEEDEEEEGEVEELNLEEEDFNLLTIEKVPMKTLTSRIGRVISEIMTRGEPGAIALFEVANKLVYQSSLIKDEKNLVIKLIIHGLTKIFLDARERHESAENGERYLSLLAAKLAVKNRAMKSEDLLLQLIMFIDRFYWHASSLVRCRVYRLIGMLMEEENRYVESMEEQGDFQFLFTDDDVEEPETIIPRGAKRRWMEKLAKSLMDKSPQARCCAVQALSLWEHGVVVKSCDELTVNDLIWKSLYDVDESVRLAAARRVHITSETEIDKCMDYVEMSTDSKISKAIVMRLASDVHLSSFSEAQRFRLINLLSNSDSVRVKDAIHLRLVPSWMTAAGEEISYLDIFPAPEPDNSIPKEFPSIILQFLNPERDPKAVHLFMKFATTRFIGQSVNLEQFLKDLLQLSNEECESVGLMRRTSYRLLSDEPENLKKTFLRVFVTRCFLDVVFELSSGRLDVLALRSRALMLLTPDVVTFTKILEEFCAFCFLSQEKHKEELTEPDGEESNENGKEVILNNILHILNVSVRFGDADFDKKVYRDALKRILEDPLLEFSEDVVEMLVLTILDLDNQEEEDDCEWIAETAKKTLLSSTAEEKDLEDAMKEGGIPDRMYRKSATMLLATCKHEKVTTPTSGMSSLFKSIIPALLGSTSGEIQHIGLQLIGKAASIDFDNCEPYLKLVVLLIQRDDQKLRATCFGTLIQVIKAKGFPDTADALFSEGDTNSDEDEARLSRLIEKTLIGFKGDALGHAVLDCLSMLSHGNYAWSKLMSVLLLIVFQKRNAELQLVKVLKLYCKSSVQSLKRKITLLMGFDRAVHTITKSSETDANCSVVEMTSLVCEAISRIHTVGEDDEQEDVHIELELVKKMLRRAVAHPSGWTVRHVFNSLATSLMLECVPMDVLKEMRERLEDAHIVLRFHPSRGNLAAFNRFRARCQKAVILKSKVLGLSVPFDLEKVKDEEELDGAKKCAMLKTSLSRKHSWDHGDSFSEDSNDSFEYFPQATRTRKRPSTSTPKTSPKKTCSGVGVEELTIESSDDSFEKFL